MYYITRDRQKSNAKQEKHIVNMIKWLKSLINSPLKIIKPCRHIESTRFFMSYYEIFLVT